jgi:hypothetical protein
MRLNVFIRLMVLFGGISGCATWNISSPAIFKSEAYDVKGEAPASLSLPENQEEMANVQNQSKADYYFTLAESYSMQGEYMTKTPSEVIFVSQASMFARV